MTTVSLTVNGNTASADVEPRTSLADFVRESVNLTGTHLGCEHGVCGACTVLVDGIPARSCITYAVACENASVTTIEGLDGDEIAGELREAFSREHGLQCGYCTPGMIVSARDVVLRLDAPSEHDIRVAMSGNLCRCTGYVGIVRAIQGVIADRRARGIAAIPDGGRSRLGPAGSGNAAAAELSARAKIVPPAAGPASSAGRTSATMPADWKPQAMFERSFVVAHPVDKVWEFFGKIEDVASCLPGASVEARSGDGEVRGRMRVKVGPIVTDFQGEATVDHDSATHTGAVVGSGKDKGSGSTTRGRVTYRVQPGDTPGQTRVDVSVGYSLSGMLAQFGRSGLVEDVANRLIGAFVSNLEVRLSGHRGTRAEGAAPAALDVGNVFFAVLMARLRRLFGR